MKFILSAKRPVSEVKRMDTWFMAALDSFKGNAVEIEVSEHHPRLPGNLQARISILIRELAEFCGYSESQMKALVKKEFYPTETISVKLKDGSLKFSVVPIRTMKLNPKQAREVENHLYDLAGEIPGCNLSIPQAKDLP